MHTTAKFSLYELDQIHFVKGVDGNSFGSTKWNNYLMGHRVIINSDQKPLKYLLVGRVID